MSLILSGSTSGAITLDTPAVAGTNTATLPAATGTVMVSGNMPAFSATGTTTVNSATVTQLTFGTEQFDTNNNFASNAFTPTVAGYYQINFGMSMASSTGQAYCQLLKNGSFYSNAVQSNGGYLTSFNGSVLLYMNGTTDTLTLQCAQFNGSSASVTSVMNGGLMRAA